MITPGPERRPEEPPIVPPSDSGSRRHGRRAALIIGAGALIAAGVVAALGIAPPRSGADEEKPPPPAVEPVSRGDLVELVRASGTLSYRGSAELTPELPGVITGLPGPGSMVGRGGELLRVDDAPVVLLLGALPVWRDFTVGMSDGADVRQLEENLAALGHFTLTPNDEFTIRTAAAVERWQESIGLPSTGTIERGRIVFLPTEVRIAGLLAAVGDAAGAPAVRVAENTKVAMVDLDADLAGIAAVGGRIEIDLPNGSRSTGTVTALGQPVEKDDGSGQQKLMVPVTLTLDDQAAADGLDQVRVSAGFTRVLAEDVLMVPVTALLAEPGGGTVVERVIDGDVERVAVELGAFADGRVEVRSPELAEGDVVVVGK